MSCWPNWRLYLCCRPRISVPHSGPPPSEPINHITLAGPQYQPPRPSEASIELEDIRPLDRETTVAIPPHQRNSSPIEQQQPRGLWEAFPGPESQGDRHGSSPPELPALSFGQGVVAGVGASQEGEAQPIPPKNPARYYGRERREHDDEDDDRPRPVDIEEDERRLTALLPAAYRGREPQGRRES